MSNKSKIEWTDATWNPVTGCTKVSAGCKHCYAERDWVRLQHLPRYNRPFTQVECHSDRLEQPLHWKKPRRIFVNSMSDLFHEDVPADFIRDVFNVMYKAKHHVFQILTKRPERMRDFMIGSSGAGANYDPIPNIWYGVSIEDQQTANERIPLLLQIPATVRWLSCEPLLGSVVLDTYLGELPEDEDGAPYPGKIDWVVVGGESGPKARPMHPDWVRSLRDQCVAAGVPFFFKQWGEYLPEGPVYPDEYGLPEDAYEDYNLSGNFPVTGVLYRDGYFYDGAQWQPHVNAGCYWINRLGKKQAGNVLEGKRWEEYPA